MSEVEMAEILGVTDEVLEIEFERIPILVDLESKMKGISAAVANPVTVGSWNSCSEACCCTLSGGGEAYLPNCTDCQPGGA